MKHKAQLFRIASVAGVCAALCLMASGAQAQRGGGRGGFRPSQAGGTRAANSASNGSSANSPTSGGSGSCPQNGSGSSSTASGTATSSGAATVYNGSAAGHANSGSNLVTAQQVSASRVALQYTGSTANVQAVYLGVLDADRRVISQTAITSGTPTATLATSASARYYGVQVVYSNGAVHTAYVPVR